MIGCPVRGALPLIVGLVPSYAGAIFWGHRGYGVRTTAAAGIGGVGAVVTFGSAKMPGASLRKACM